MSYMRTGLGLSLSDITKIAGNVGTAVKPISPAAGGVLSNVTSAIQNLFGAQAPAAAAAPAYQPSPGMPTAVKIGLGVGAVGVGFLLVKALKK